MGKKSDLLKKNDSSSSDMEEEEASSFEASIDEAVDAIASGDKDTAKAALKAAITAYCADMYSDMEE
jgi:DNA-binding GntR family transcriptional regulator